MISAWHLLCIIPVSSGFGIFLTGITSSAARADELHDWMKEQENRK